ncbi:MAG: M20/M25/M40 family metallo-hydrolase [Gemmatimonadetes bacterium]|nr:M20/M25/M40 family metallo-hydrolase [Gemmatimonadota bacterium]
MRRLVLVSLLFLPLGLGAQRPTRPADVKRLLYPLADDSMAGRLTGSPGEAAAARFIAAEMKRIGLKPLGDSGYFQRVAVVAMPLAQPSRRGATERLMLLKSLADLDTMPADRRRPSVNVVGVLEGSDPLLKDEVVLVDAHFDHIGVGLAINGDSIYNGADDDASGVTAVLEIARQLSGGPQPKRTVLFVATTGEEVGLFGTRWFIDHPPIPLSRFVANLEIEMIGRPDSLAGGPGKAWLTGYERSNMGEQLAQAGIPIVPDKRPDQHFFERSDNIAFARKGIVAHTLSSYNLHTDYHQPTDDVKGIDLEHMATVVNAAARAVRLLADGPKPEWKPGGMPVAPAPRAPGVPRPVPPTPVPPTR